MWTFAYATPKSVSLWRSQHGRKDVDLFERTFFERISTHRACSLLADRSARSRSLSGKNQSLLRLPPLTLLDAVIKLLTPWITQMMDRLSPHVIWNSSEAISSPPKRVSAHYQHTWHDTIGSELLIFILKVLKGRLPVLCPGCSGKERNTNSISIVNVKVRRRYCGCGAYTWHDLVLVKQSINDTDFPTPMFRTTSIRVRVLLVCHREYQIAATSAEL